MREKERYYFVLWFIVLQGEVESIKLYTTHELKASAYKAV